MGGMSGLVDAKRAILRIGGEEARSWLQDLVTNNVETLAPGAPVYAALLTPQGKYLFDFFLIDGRDGTVLLDVAADRAPALAQRLGMYRIRRKVEIADATVELGVALIWGDGPPAIDGAFVEPDPRAPSLGWRIYAADAGAALSAAAAAPAERAAYDALRVAIVAPESGVELLPDETFILEAGFDRLNGVDFRKGCYVGQEVTARMRHKTELRKGLRRVRVEGEAPPPGAALSTAEGKAAGALFTVVAGEGLAHLRLDRATGPMTAEGATVTAVETG